VSPTTRNALLVARREFLWRVRSRAFLATTLILVLITLALALAPVLAGLVDRDGRTQPVGVHAARGVDAPAVTMTLARILSAPAVPGLPASAGAYEVRPIDDLEQGRSEVRRGALSALLEVRRDPTGDLGFTLHSGARSFERTPQLLRQAAGALAIADRLARQGISPDAQASLFAPPAFAQVDPEPGAARGGPDAEFAGNMGVGFILAIFIFMAVMLYGNWVAMSVAEEKSSRVMEVILGAAKPFELLAGKVLGVGTLALVQYLVVFTPAALVLAFQGAIAASVLGDRGAVSLPGGVTPGLLAAFAAFFVLGFLLYAVLYAAAGSLVSRQEDVNTVVAPLTIISTLGYVTAAWAATGLISASSPLLGVLSFVPFTSPYLMLPRIATGGVGPAEVAVALAILVASIVVALRIAARIYAAGVLLYGQRPGIRPLWKSIRQSG
jgi:ABC-2 type transport system permease protein